MYDPGWLHNNRDMLQARLKSTEIIETLSELGPINLQMINVGGQRPELNMWIYCFKDVGCLIFMAALAGYTQCVAEYQNDVSAFPTLLSHQNFWPQP